MSQCANCPKPAVMTWGPSQVPLCIDCYSKLAHALDLQNAAHERMLNYLSDEMSVIAGLPPIGPRFPERRPPVTVTGATFHSINVKDSNVGVINTGQLHQVDTAVSVIGQQGDPQLAGTLKILIEAVMAHANMGAENQREAVEILSALGSEAVLPKEQRRAGVARPLIGRLRELLSVASDLATVGQASVPIISAAFGIG